LTTDPDGRAVLRRRLLAQREQFAQGPQAGIASASLARQLREVLAQLEPQCLGLYWPIRGEFNSRVALGDDNGHSIVNGGLQLALPFCRRAPREMHYRLWDGQPPRAVDECQIPASDASPVEPDAVLVPCLGYTADGYRLGYGGGYFDRWLAAYPHVTSVGLAWSIGQLDDAAFARQPHDQALTMLLTEDGIVMP
jgi:5,10-methenyltetrahydrofolate synthetase